MAIGIVRDNSEFDREISRVIVVDKPIVNKVIDAEVIEDNKESNLGRGIGNTEVSDVVRKFVAELGIDGYSNKEIKDITNLSQSSISAYKNGAKSTSSYNEPDKELALHITKVKDKISRKARKVAIASLDILLEPGRIANAKTRDIATIARSASAIIKDMEVKKDEVKTNNDNRVQFIMMAPQVRPESSYDAIDVSVHDS